MSAAIAPNPNDPQAPLGMPARPWWIGYIRQLHLDIPLAVEYGGTGKNTPLDASDIAETDALKILTATERTKLTGIAEGAEVNAVDSVAGRTGDVTLDADDVAPTTSKLWMSDTQSTKLAGIAENANNYTHPATHPQSMIEGLADALAGKQNAANALTTNTDQIVNSIKTFYKPFITSPNATSNYSAFSIGTVPNGLVWYLQFKPATKELNWFTTKEGLYPVPMGFTWDPVRAVFPVSPTVPTPTAGDNSTLAASTAFVQAKAAGALLTEGTPSGPTATGTMGMARFDADYFYVCTATNTWVRFAKDGSWT